MGKEYTVSASDLASSLKWALANVPERLETAAGMSCKYCTGNAKDGGYITSPVSHTQDCPYRRAYLLLDLWSLQKLRGRQKAEDGGCMP